MLGHVIDTSRVRIQESSSSATAYLLQINFKTLVQIGHQLQAMMEHPKKPCNAPSKQVDRMFSSPPVVPQPKEANGCISFDSAAAQATCLDTHLFQIPVLTVGWTTELLR